MMFSPLNWKKSMQPKTKIFPNRTLDERVQYCKDNIWNKYAEDSPFYLHAVLSLSYLWCSSELITDSVFFDELETFFYPNVKQLNLFEDA